MARYLEQLGAHLTNLGSWRDGDKCILAAVLTLPFVFAWMLRLALVLEDPALGAYLNLEAVGPMLAFVCVQAVGYVVIAAAGLWLRSEPGSHPWLIHSTIQFWFVCFFLDLFAIGPYTSPFGMLLLVFPVLGFMTFGIRPVALGLVVFGVLLVLSTLAERLSLIPYAPLMHPHLLHEGRPYTTWILSLGVIPLVASSVVLAVFAYVVVQWKDRERQLAELCRIDYLTGVENRRSFMERAEIEFLRAQRYGKPLAIVLVDVDHFKRVNDCHGHGVGDEMLKVVAETLAGQVRRHDGIARYGGEEFALVLAETSAEQARLMAERCRVLIESAALIRAGEVVRVTASMGIAALPQADVDRVERLIDLADEALYQAKSRGRNRVASAA